VIGGKSLRLGRAEKPATDGFACLWRRL